MEFFTLQKDLSLDLYVMERFLYNTGVKPNDLRSGSRYQGSGIRY